MLSGMQVLITCSLVLCTCLVWFAWVVHTFLQARRLQARRDNQRMELALAGIPVPVGVPETLLTGALLRQVTHSFCERRLAGALDLMSWNPKNVRVWLSTGPLVIANIEHVC